MSPSDRGGGERFSPRKYTNVHEQFISKCVCNAREVKKCQRQNRWIKTVSNVLEGSKDFDVSKSKILQTSYLPSADNERSFYKPLYRVQRPINGL